jgi:CRISPR-associated endoribonuclease Cas6
MRIQLSLRPVQKTAVVPINYSYPLAAAIYKILQHASPAYAEFLHKKGYAAPSGRLMKLFTFSKLWIPNVRQREGRLIGGDGLWRLQVGSPLLDEFVQNFVLGLFQSSEIAIGGQGCHAEFHVQQVEALPTPEFGETTRCKCLSPVAASTVHDSERGRRIYYYRPHDAELSVALRKNLLEKYQIIHGQQPADDRFSFRLEANDRPKSRLLIIKEGTPAATQIKAFESHFTLEGSPELMQTAWECGLGEHNSQGFGMIEVVS